MLRNKTALKIFSLLAAILLWLYVIGEVDPEARVIIRDIPVTLVNTQALTENGLAAVWEEEVFVNATIEGRRSDVNDVKKTGLTAYIDAAQFTRGKNTAKISINAPDGISIETISKSTLRVRVQKLTEAQKPVEIEFADTVNGADKMPWILDMEPQQIAVSGAKQSVDRIAAFKGIISESKVTEDKSRRVNVDVIPVTEDGEQVLGVQAETGKVKVEVQMLISRTVGLEITVKNTEKGMETAELDAARRIHIVGPVDTLEGLENVTGTVDLTGITDTATVEVQLDLPENTFLADGSDGITAEVTMKETDQ